MAPPDRSALVRVVRRFDVRGSTYLPGAAWPIFALCADGVPFGAIVAGLADGTLTLEGGPQRGTAPWQAPTRPRRAP